jgi:hypothetical protein
MEMILQLAEVSMNGGGSDEELIQVMAEYIKQIHDDVMKGKMGSVFILVLLLNVFLTRSMSDDDFSERPKAGFHGHVGGHGRENGVPTRGKHDLSVWEQPQHCASINVCVGI